jgi:molecular chaperone GrpE
MSDADDVVIEPEEDGEVATPEQKLKKLRAELVEAKKEAADNLAGWQRAKADYVNLDRRVRRASGEAGKTAAKAVALGFITVMDSLEAAAQGINGLEGIVKQADDVFKTFGIVRFTPRVGDTFDPAREESVQTLATGKEEEDNTITGILQSGYELDGMIIRPARVIIKSYQNVESNI